MKKSLLLLAALFAGLSGYALEQDADGYYLLGSVDDWNAFSELVATTNDANARMTADIDLGDSQATIGHPNENPSYHFKGIFDGQGYTLTVHYVPQGAKDICSPFPNISEATIKNLHIDGTIVSSTACQPAAIGCVRYGTSTIEKVWSSVELTSTKSSWCEASGLVGCVDGYKNGHLVMNDCMVSGNVTSSGSYEGCFIGYVNSRGSASVNHCLSVATFTYSGTSGFMGNYTNCYVKQFPSAIPEAMQCNDEQLADGTIAAALQADREDVVWIQAPETNQPALAVFSGNHLRKDADGYYLLRSVADWDSFAELVIDEPIANARMVSDIDLGDDQTMIGSGNADNNSGSGNIIYKGHFDGNGHTLTINYIANEPFVAPFRHIQDATIENLHVAGTITTDNRYAGGIVSACYGEHIHSYITNCYSSVNIKSSYVNNGDFYGGAWHGGIAARLYYYGQLHITDCLFDGKISGETKNVVWGGMMGLPDGTVTFTNCLQIGTLEAEGVIGGSNGSGTFATRFSNGYASFINVNNSYYRTPFGNAQGIQATDEQLVDGTTATALQAGRVKKIWVQDNENKHPIQRIFLRVDGDVNRDGVVDVDDVNILVNIILGIDSADNYDGRANVDHQGGIDVSDINAVISIITGK